MVRITRRDFLKYCSISAGALGLSATTLMHLDKAIAKETTENGVPVIWIDGAACTGCSVSLLNSAFYTDAADLLINTLDLNFHKTLMTAAGAVATGYNSTNALTVARDAYNGIDNGTNPATPLYVLVIEGGIQCGKPKNGQMGEFCTNGNLTGTSEGSHNHETMLYNIQRFAKNALAVLSVGTCASFGGIPGGRGSATDSRGALYRGTQYGKGALLDPTVSTFTSGSPLTNVLGMPIEQATINISGCPPHPDWIVGTIAHIVSNLPPIATILGWLGTTPPDTGSVKSALAASLPQLTNYRRPRDYGYGEYQCNAGPCVWRYNNSTKRAKNTDSYGNWTPNPWPYQNLSTDPFAPWGWNDPSWTGGPAGTVSPDATYYSGEPDYNNRYPEGDSKKLGRNKWTGKDLGCLGILGCKGRKTKADCSRRRWNTPDAETYGVNWCVGSRGNCHGCTEPTFPDRVGKFYTFV